MRAKGKFPPFLIIFFIAASPFLLIFLVDEDSRRGVAPEIQGIESWINSKPLKIGALKGKVVLVDFWTYSCINCLRTIPYLNQWHHQYGKDGLVIIGVHSPEFTFEKSNEGVMQAVKELEIQYPVALDNNRRTWKAYSNSFWPHKYLIDSGGNIRFEQIGEGGYKETEEVIRKLLTEAQYPVDDMRSRVIVEPVQHKEIKTPEIFIGSHRNQFLGNPRGLRIKGRGDFIKPDTIGQDLFYLVGLWEMKDEYARFEGKEPGRVILNYSAKSVHMVARAPGRLVEVEVKLNGYPLRPKTAGRDIAFDSTGRSWVTISEGRLYSLVHDQDQGYGRHTLTLIIKARGLEAYTFSFG